MRSRQQIEKDARPRRGAMAVPIQTMQELILEVLLDIREQSRLCDLAKKVVQSQWEHRCIDKVGGCTAVSASALSVLEANLR